MRDGILTHTGPHEPQTLEGKIVRIVDRVAYINHDIDDAIRCGLLTPDDLPRAEIELLGETGSSRIDTLVHDLIESSERAGDIVQSDEVGTSMLALRAFMFERVYLGEHARGEHVRAHATISAIFEHLVERGDSQEEIRTFISGMTDRFALQYAERTLMARIKETSVGRSSRRQTWWRSSPGGRHCARRAHAIPAAVLSMRSGRRASQSTRPTSCTTASAAARAAT